MDNLPIKKTSKKKRIFTEEELKIMQLYKDNAKNKSYRSCCTCPPGFKGAGAFCSVHRD